MLKSKNIQDFNGMAAYHVDRNPLKGTITNPRYKNTTQTYNEHEKRKK